MPMISVEGPELKSVSAVFRFLEILLQPQRPVGGFENLGVRVQLETSIGAVGSTGRRHGGERKPKRNPCFSQSVAKHCLIPRPRLVTEGVQKVRTRRINPDGPDDQDPGW